MVKKCKKSLRDSRAALCRCQRDGAARPARVMHSVECPASMLFITGVAIFVVGCTVLFFCICILLRLQLR